jgi:hypothetical protein
MTIVPPVSSGSAAVRPLRFSWSSEFAERPEVKFVILTGEAASTGPGRTYTIASKLSCSFCLIHLKTC